MRGRMSVLIFRNLLWKDAAAKTAGSPEDTRKSRFDRNGICAADGSVVLCAIARLQGKQDKRALMFFWPSLNERKLCKGPAGG